MNINKKIIKKEDFIKEIESVVEKRLEPIFKSLSFFKKDETKSDDTIEKIKDYCEIVFSNLSSKETNIKYYGVIRNSGDSTLDNTLVTLGDRIDTPGNVFFPVIDIENIIAIRRDCIEFLEKGVWDMLNKKK